MDSQDGNTNIVADQTDMLLAPLTVTRKLDADQYYAEDLDGVTEGLFGSGNLNYLSMQVNQPEAVIQLGDFGFIPNAYNGEGMGSSATGYDLIGTGEGPVGIGEKSLASDFGAFSDGISMRGAAGQVGYASSTAGTIGGTETTQGQGLFSGGNLSSNSASSTQNITSLGAQNGTDGNNGTDGQNGNDGNCNPGCYPDIPDACKGIDLNLDQVLVQVNNVLINLDMILDTTFEGVTTLTDQVFNFLNDVSLCDVLCLDQVFDVVDALLVQITDLVQITQTLVDGVTGNVTALIDKLSTLPDISIDVLADIADVIKAEVDVLLDDSLTLIADADLALDSIGDLGGILDGEGPGALNNIDALIEKAGDFTDLNVLKDGLESLYDTIQLGGNSKDNDIGLATDVETVDQMIADVELHLVTDVVEDLAGDIDAQTDLSLDLLGDSVTDNSAGDQDIDIDVGLEVANNALGDLTKDINLDPVENITGDIDLDVDLAADILGNQAQDLIDAEDGGTGGDSLTAQLGDALGVTVDNLIYDQSQDSIYEAAGDAGDDEVLTLVDDVLSVQSDTASLTDQDGLGVAGSVTEAGTIEAGLFDDIVGGNALDVLPEHDGTVGEGLGVLDVDPSLDITSGGLFG